MSLHIHQVSKAFDDRQPVLENLELQIASGEFVCLLGASGCGKSTLLNLIAGLDTPTGGSILHNGREITGPGTDRSYLFQESALFPWLNVLENVKFPMRMAGVPRQEQTEKALHYLEMVNLADYRTYRVHELSGGMKQRVALARALTIDSDILLMDEPFAALDSHTREELSQHLLRIWGQTGKTILFVTHSIEEAFLLADRVVLISAHSRVCREYALSRPRNLSSAHISAMMDEVRDCLSHEVPKIAS